MPGGQETEKLVRGKMAVLEVAVLLYADALEVPCARLMQAMRQRGVTGLRATDLAREARKIANQLDRSRMRALPPQASQLVRDVLPEAPVPKETRIPADWNLDESRVRSSRDGVVGEIQAPVVITGRGKDVARDTEYSCVAWFRDGRWHLRIVDREVLANAQKIIALAAYGLPVNSNNARLLVQYMAEYEAANVGTLPIAKVSRKLGDHGGRVPGGGRSEPACTCCVVPTGGSFSGG
jgi:hypothetical protein